MSEENVELVRRLYETWNGTGAFLWDAVDPSIDVEFVEERRAALT
jgi:hypothetical protein